ncbi:hypothetical protein VitviT2T_013023 [Vitis vinifera]|uniref:TFIIB-type domain-containing protein n=2 Tax=Vitis vinifera TaxID=29760 RepID=A0ABY9CFH0_VITVI|nr:hypothetical protein VitviT2T_013023 [Vitis vinifera]
MADAFCTDCKKNTEVVFDHSAGDTVCSECGLVLESHSIDETSEWRTFANESGDNDPVRVGGPSNPLLTDGGLSTVIAKPNGVSGDFLSSSLGRWQNRGSNPDRGLILAFKTIATMSDRLGLVATIKDRANEIYKKVEDQKSTRGRNQDALLAACLYIACRQEDKPRTVKEICSVANGATKKEIGRAKEYIVKQLEAEKGQSVEMGTIHAGDFMRRFCSNLGMTNQVVKAAQEAVQKSEEFDIRRSPVSIAAAVIYIITQLSDEKKLLRDISIATGVAEGTIRNSYKDLYPHISKIIPSCLSPSSSLPTNPYNHQPQHRRRKKKTASTLLQKEVIGIVEDEDWASSSGGASNSEIYLQDANDEEEHYCISGSISNLQFSKAVSKAIWNDEIGMAAVVEKKGKIWITTGVVRNSKTYCSIEETFGPPPLKAQIEDL